MRPGKVLARLVAVLPATIAPSMRSHGRCIAATHVAIDVLRHFGIEAEPLAVDVWAINAIAAQWYAEGSPGGPAEFERRGAYLLTTREAPGAVQREPTRPHVGRGWSGHLVAYLPARGVIVDADMRQIARPEFGLVTPDALVIPWDGEAQECRSDDGCSVVYRRRLDAFGRPDQVWRDAPDWREPVDDLVEDVIRAIRR